MARNGKIVIRPDSGDPIDIICGTASDWKDISKYFPEGEVKAESFEDYLLNESQNDVAHGEAGPEEYTAKCAVNGKYYEATIHNLSYNRYDKQYYYLDMWGKAKITFKEIEVTPAMKGVIQLLWEGFGGTVNEQGYKVLDPHVGAIYGDSITLERAEEICKRLEAKGFASTNIVLGIGSYTFNYNTRDSLGIAIKSTYCEVARDVWDEGVKGTTYGHIEKREIFKDPITDDGTKKSAKGLLAVYKKDGVYFLKDQATWHEMQNCSFKHVFENGKLLVDTSLSEIRKLANTK